MGGDKGSRRVPHQKTTHNEKALTQKTSFGQRKFASRRVACTGGKIERNGEANGRKGGGKKKNQMEKT